MKSAYRILVGEREGKRLLGRHRQKWEDNIKMDLKLGGMVLKMDSSGLGTNGTSDCLF
jgi:hypothetical protein